MSQSIKDQLINLGFGKSDSQARTSTQQNKPLHKPRPVHSDFTREDLTWAMKCFFDYLAWHTTETDEIRCGNSRAANESSTHEPLLQATQSKSTTSNEIPNSSESRIVAIEPDAKLLLTKRNNQSIYKLRTEADAGINPRFDDDGTEVTIGLDFGTSSVKVVLKIESDFVAVPFVLTTGIDAYLLPTRLYQDSNEAFTLSPDTQLSHSGLKLDLLANPSSRKAQINAGIFLALVLRHIRSWFFNTYSKYDAQNIAWECAIGYPSTENDSQTAALWKALLYRSWQLSVQPEDITLAIAEDIWQQPLEAFEDEISFDYFRCMPEVVAAVAGFNRNQPIVDDFKGNYTLVDIGSGTVDVSTFAYTKTVKQYTHNRTQFTSKVAHLGTTNCHHNRLNWLRTLFLTATQSSSFTSCEKTLFSNFIENIDLEQRHSLLEPLRDSVAEYLSGVTIEPTKDLVDKSFGQKLTELIGSVRMEAVRKHFVDTNDVSRMPIFLCGGGARSLFYRNSFMRKHQNISWLAPKRIFETHALKDLAEGMVVPIEQDNYDRLLVAYGLCAEEPPKTFVATPLGDQPVKKFNPFIDWGGARNLDLKVQAL